MLQQYTPILFSTLGCPPNSNQSQSKPEMNRLDTLFKNLKQSKRKILKSLKKFKEREEQGYGIEHIELIHSFIEESSERLRKFENNVEHIHNYIIDEWEGDDEQTLIDKLTSDSIKYDDYVWEFTKRSYEIIDHIENMKLENKFNKFNLTTGKETNNLIKLNSTNDNIKVFPKNNTDHSICLNHHIAHKFPLFLHKI